MKHWRRRFQKDISFLFSLRRALTPAVFRKEEFKIHRQNTLKRLRNGLPFLIGVGLCWVKGPSIYDVRKTIKKGKSFKTLSPLGKWLTFWTNCTRPGLRDPAEAAPHARGGGEAEAVRDPRLLRGNLAVPQQRLQRGRLPKVLPARPGKKDSVFISFHYRDRRRSFSWVSRMAVRNVPLQCVYSSCEAKHFTKSFLGHRKTFFGRLCIIMSNNWDFKAAWVAFIRRNCRKSFENSFSWCCAAAWLESCR